MAITDTEETTTYDVKVVVEFNFEVEANSKEEAEERGWYWEDYTNYAEVYSIDVDEAVIYDDEEDKEE